jgi:hypothetical protein
VSFENKYDVLGDLGGNISMGEWVGMCIQRVNRGREEEDKGSGLELRVIHRVIFVSLFARMGD